MNGSYLYCNNLIQHFILIMIKKQIQHFFLTMVFDLWTKDEEFSLIYFAKHEQIKIHEIMITIKNG